jgi:hypothetical protein
MSRTLEDLGLSLKKVQSRHHRALDAQLLRLGVSLVQWNALREIDRNPGSTAHRLAELTFNSDQAFGTLTTRLLRWVSSNANPAPDAPIPIALRKLGK